MLRFALLTSDPHRVVRRGLYPWFETCRDDAATPTAGNPIEAQSIEKAIRYCGIPVAIGGLLTGIGTCNATCKLAFDIGSQKGLVGNVSALRFGKTARRMASPDEGQMPVDLNEQGEPLPHDFPYKGDWMLKPRIFLYLPDEPTTVAQTVPQFTVSLNPLDENGSFGFDVTRVAAAFETTPEAIFVANRRGKLTLENVFANTPNGDNATAKIYVLGFGGKTVELTLEVISQAGRA